MLELGCEKGFSVKGFTSCILNRDNFEERFCCTKIYNSKSWYEWWMNENTSELDVESQTYPARLLGLIQFKDCKLEESNEYYAIVQTSKDPLSMKRL